MHFSLKSTYPDEYVAWPIVFLPLFVSLRLSPCITHFFFLLPILTLYWDSNYIYVRQFILSLRSWRLFYIFVNLFFPLFDLKIIFIDLSLRSLIFLPSPI